MTGDVRKFESNITTYFNIRDKQLLKRCNQIQRQVKSLLKIKIDSEPVYGDSDKYIKTKIKTYNGVVNTNFQGKKMAKEKAPCKSLTIIMLDSVVKAKKKYYPQKLLEEWKNEAKKTKKDNLIYDDLEKENLVVTHMLLSPSFVMK